MEQFKACEKETKTKAYSKEGLGQTKQDNDGRGEARNWVGMYSGLKSNTSVNNIAVRAITSIKTQIDQFESELESIFDHLCHLAYFVIDTERYTSTQEEERIRSS